MDKNKKDAYKAALVAYVLGTVLLFATPYFWIVTIPAAIVVVPMVFILAIARGGYLIGGTAALLSFATVCLMGYRFYGILALVLLPFIFGAAYAIRSKRRFRDSVMISAFAALAGAVLAIGAIQMMSGMGIVDFAVEKLGQALKTFGDAEIGLFYQSVRSPDILSGAVTQEAVLATSPARAITFMQDAIREALNVSLVAIIVTYSLAMGLGGYLIARAAAKKRGVDVAAIPPFADYALPRRFWIAAVLSILFALIGDSYGWASFDILLATIYSAYAAVFIVQGLSFFDFMLTSRKMGRGVRVILNVLAALIFSNVLVWVGMIENAIEIRKRLKERWESK